MSARRRRRSAADCRNRDSACRGEGGTPSGLSVTVGEPPRWGGWLGGKEKGGWGAPGRRGWVGGELGGRGCCGAGGGVAGPGSRAVRGEAKHKAETTGRTSIFFV